jgi:OmcA/MtrC family decaheme c-type cytochrome
LLPEKPVVTIEDISRAGDILTVRFSVAGTGDVPVVGIGTGASSGSDLRVYMADIVPANTPTANAPVSTWVTAEPERWAADTGTTAGVVYSEGPPGTYTFTMATPVTVVGDPAGPAPEGDLATHYQRVYVRADPRDFGVYDRTMAVADFMMPAAGGSTGPVSGTPARNIVVMKACTNCHNDPLQGAAHGGGYQSPQVCVMCHTPIGTTYGDDMQASGFWLTSLIHTIHGAGVLPGWPDGNNPVSFEEVTYPRAINDCLGCHFDEGQVNADAWKDNPSIQSCTTCHDVTFTGSAPTHTGGAQTNASCGFCHPADGAITQAVYPVSTVHAIDNVPTYTSTITLSPDANNDGVYETGEQILVTVTTSNVAAGDYAVPGAIKAANLYVYGPRAKALPVMTTGSTTDPAFELDLQADPYATPDQGHSMLVDSSDPQVETDASGFKYLTLPVTADMAAGTYMVMAYVTTDLADCSQIYRNSVCTDGWDLVTFQVKESTPTDRVAGPGPGNADPQDGSCGSCHNLDEWGALYHRSYFGTDGCIACHDQSGNHADPLTNRVHAVHAASANGDLLGVDWSEVTYPQSIAACATCHDSGNNSYRNVPRGYWGYACIGCHADRTTGSYEHMKQNGSPFPTE